MNDRSLDTLDGPGPADAGPEERAAEPSQDAKELAERILRTPTAGQAPTKIFFPWGKPARHSSR